MATKPIYLDNHATTRTDPRVVEAMLPYFTEVFGNAGSTSHVFGWEALEAVKQSRSSMARILGANERDIVFTSGATESNNLAIKGLAERQRRKGSHIVSVKTEHKSVLDPLARLSRRGFEITLLDVAPADDPQAGRVDLRQVAAAIRDDTILVTIMLANNEVGVLQPISEIAAICHERKVILHTDATQAVGKIPLNVDELGIDLMSFSAHKIYGPKGVGALYLRRKNPAVRLEPLSDGGGQEGGVRSGTLNVPGIVGFAKALELCHDELNTEPPRLAELRNRLFEGITKRVEHVRLNGPTLHDPTLRLPGNLNCSFAYVDGEALMMSMRDIALSSGSACTSANPEPSHVLRAMGLSDDLTRASLRFGLGRFTTEDEIAITIDSLAETVGRLRSLSTLRND